MLPPTLPFHNLHPNAREDTPWHVMYADTESEWRSDGRDEVHTPRLWYARHRRRHPAQGWPEDAGEGWGPDAEGLCDYIAATVTTKHPLWVFFHGLSFDLGLTKLPLLMMARGWRLGMHALASDAPWCNLQLGKRSVWVVDSFSWFRKSLAEVGGKVGVTKAPLPTQDGSDEDWWGRIAADVDILDTAITQLMDWWDAGRLGHWSHTGPACGWNTLRHMCGRSDSDAYRQSRDRLGDGTVELSQGKVVVCTDPGVRRFEREAIYQGMREVSYVGRLHEGAWANLDLERAHLGVCRTRLLPCKLIDAGDSLPIDSPKIGGRFTGVIARCRVRATERSWPVRAGDHILHPVGEFWTVLCDPELVEARERGQLLEVGRWQCYLLNHYMQPWARWVESILDGSDDSAPPAAWLAAKAWSRTVVGKWAGRTSKWEAIGESAEWGWWSAPALPTAGTEAPGMVQLGHTLYDVHRDQDADDAFPAVLAWVQSWVRRQLRQLIAEVGPEHVVQCNTDGVLWNAQAGGAAPGGWDETGRPEPVTWNACEAVAEAVGDAIALPVRLKGIYRTGAMLSPQHMQLDGVRVMAGIPGRRDVVQVGLAFGFLTWPSLRGQMSRGLEDGYRRRWVERDLSRCPVGGWRCEDGCVAPVWVTVGPVGEVVTPGATSCEHGSRPVPADRQAGWLNRITHS